MKKEERKKGLFKGRKKERENIENKFHLFYSLPSFANFDFNFSDKSFHLMIKLVFINVTSTNI